MAMFFLRGLRRQGRYSPLACHLLPCGFSQRIHVFYVSLYRDSGTVYHPREVSFLDPRQKPIPSPSPVVHDSSVLQRWEVIVLRVVNTDSVRKCVVSTVVHPLLRAAVSLVRV